ncbi:hypothetical protein NDU88_004073 [Pleurodeles waltl]|uniref:Uncharacterized protein n=1 Tax=Pleurodeles waltl TaxID=8319 RepID=A0AAV7SHQ6_PLEWA|nr:hypothetical protein NDU88_004073 [Pleurodeles waltl]
MRNGGRSRAPPSRRKVGERRRAPPAEAEVGERRRPPRKSGQQGPRTPSRGPKQKRRGTRTPSRGPVKPRPVLDISWGGAIAHPPAAVGRDPILGPLAAKTSRGAPSCSP